MTAQTTAHAQPRNTRGARSKVPLTSTDDRATPKARNTPPAIALTCGFTTAQHPPSFRRGPSHWVREVPYSGKRPT